MNILKNNNKDQLDIMRKVGKKTNMSQRELATELGFSLGKLNYCLKELRKKGFIKIKNFRNSSSKSDYMYALTPAGLITKKRLIVAFMKLKMKEYDELKLEIDN